MTRVLLDVNVFVSGVVSRGVCAAILDAWLGGRFEIVASPLLIAELEEVLARRKFRGVVVPDERDALVQLIRDRGIVVDDVAAERVTRDPEDDYVIALARSAGASVVVSGDADLLVLKISPPVMSPRTFLGALAPEAGT